MEGKLCYKDWFDQIYNINQIFDDHNDPIHYGLKNKVDKAYKLYLKGDAEKKFSFITINDMKQGPESFNKFKQFGKDTEYLFNDVIWWIESGKYENKPHWHYHALGRIATKDLKGRMAPKWNKLMGTNLKGKDDKGKPIYLCKRHNDSKIGKEPMPPYEQWWKEKMDYVINSNKGTHENYCDTIAQQGFGVTGVFTSEFTPL